MQRINGILTAGSFVVVLAMLTACGGVKVRPSSAPPPPVNSPVAINPATNPGTPATSTRPGNDPPKPSAGPPVIISANQLAQELADDANGAFSRYVGKQLQVEGVVAEQRLPSGLPTKPGDAVGGILFKVQVKDKKTGAAKEYLLHCNLTFGSPIPASDPRAAQLAKGKTVTIRGKMTGVDLGFPQATLNDCVLVGGEAPAPKGK